MITARRLFNRLVFLIAVLVLFISCNTEQHSGYVVRFYSEGREYCKSQTVEYGQKLTAPESPEAPSEEFYFTGWYSDNSKWDFSYGVAHDMILEARFDLVALKFACEGSFKIKPDCVSGVNLRYSLDNGQNWIQYNGADEIQVENTIYFRGTDNTIITGFDVQNPKSWILKPDNEDDKIKCSGNIEAILDYDTVISGSHPEMGDGCFFGLFTNCPYITSTPQLPAVELSDFCYGYMFMGCTGLRTICTLPQVDSYAPNCYAGMFASCPQLRFVPWTTSSEPFFITKEGVTEQALYMLDGEAPQENTSYYYFYRPVL